MLSSMHSSLGTASPGRVGKGVNLRVVPKAVRTPHSGYHYDGRKSKFFEGWYFKVDFSHLPHNREEVSACDVRQRLSSSFPWIGKRI